MRQHRHRLVGVAVACIPSLAVIPAPVGVVIMGPNKLIDLWYTVDLHTLSCRAALSGKAKGMVLVKLFFEGEKIGKTRVGYAFDIAHLGTEPRRSRSHHRPPVFECPRGVGKHQAMVVVAISYQITDVLLLAKGRSTDIIVRSAAKTTKGEW